MSNFSEYYPYAFALVIAIPFLVFVRQFVYAFIKLKNKEIQLLNLQSNTENKLQAYERMTLFLERLKPSNLITKFDKELEPHEFLFLLEKSINEEFEYNAAQQLYIRQKTWNNIISAKNEILKSAQKTYETLNNNASLKDYKTIFLMNYLSGEDYISESINDLRKDVLMLS